MAVEHRREEVKNRIRDAADIVQIIGECVELKRAGARFTGRCPFHAEKTPSFSVNPQGQFFHCFGCGESGDVFTFVMKFHHLSFPEALKHLADRYQIALPQHQMTEEERARIKAREELYAANEAAAEVYAACLAREGAAARARSYLVERGVPEQVIRDYRLGYAPGPEDGGWSFIIERLQGQGISMECIERVGLAVRKDNGGHYDRFRNRVLFPIQDMTGKVVAFGGRVLGDERPKYMNSPESPVFNKSRLLFGLYPHRQAIRQQRRAIVVEGNFDLLLLAVHGIDNVVAPLGTSLTPQHVKSLGGYCEEVILLFDGDSAGLRAAMRSIPYFLAEQVDARVALLPDGHDPDTLVRQQGRAAVTALVEAARPLAEFAFDALVQEHGLTLTGKSRIVEALKPLLQSAANQEQRALMTAHFSEKLGLQLGQIQVAAPPPVAQPAAPEAAAEAYDFAVLPRHERQVVDFLILFPEYLEDLCQAGLETVVQAPALAALIGQIRQLSQTGRCSPEQLMRHDNPAQRSYVANLLTRDPGPDIDDVEEAGQQMRDELLVWLATRRRQRKGADLQQRIKEAQRCGDLRLLQELLRQKQEGVRKSIETQYNMLKKY
jgi:DNA primase